MDTEHYSCQMASISKVNLLMIKLTAKELTSGKMEKK